MLSLALALALCLSLFVPALAASEDLKNLYTITNSAGKEFPNTDFWVQKSFTTDNFP